MCQVASRRTHRPRLKELVLHKHEPLVVQVDEAAWCSDLFNRVEYADHLGERLRCLFLSDLSLVSLAEVQPTYVGRCSVGSRKELRLPLQRLPLRLSSVRRTR